MAKQKESNDNTLLVGLGSLFLGAAMAGPSKDDAARIQEFRRNELLFNHYKKNLPDFQAFLIQKETERKRIVSLGKIRVKPSIQAHPTERQLFNNAIQLYIQGFFRFSVIACAMAIESLLKKKYGVKKFVELIEKAEEEGILAKNDRKYIDGLRLDRNVNIHSVEEDVTQENAKLAILVAIRVLNAIL